MKISILTLFPEMFNGPFGYSIIKNASQKKLVTINFVNIRDFGIGKHRSVDDAPYGGGNGMVLKVDVLAKAIEKTRDPDLTAKKQRVILLDPHGKTFNQKKAQELSKLKHIILVCGHYEGVDARIDKFIDETVSIGNFITTGGEIPAMLITDSVIRLIKGTLKKGVTAVESFSPYLEYPQYTRPKVYKKISVPKILLSGNHKEINKWRQDKSLESTIKFRPDLIAPKDHPKKKQNY